MKNLVFCSDGTRNTPKDRTNVYQLYNMLDESPSQVKAYDKGIGTKCRKIMNQVTGSIFSASAEVHTPFAVLQAWYACAV